MFVAIIQITCITRNLPADGRLMSIQKLDYLVLGFFVLHEDINLISLGIFSDVNGLWPP